MSRGNGEASASRSSALQLRSRSSKVIHVAGTNGKGSVCAMIDTIARAADHRTGLFTSPHLISFRERVRVNGEMISENDVAGGLTEIRALIGDWDPHPTFFEITTGLALQHFQKTRCEILVLETGMGGRLDATNAIQSSVSVITPIDFDHEKWLGHSIVEIAKEKAGIIKPRTPVVSAPQRPEAEAIIRQRAKGCDAPLQFVNERATILLAILRDKNVAAIVEALRPIASQIVLLQIRSERALPPNELAQVISAITPSLPYSTTPSVAEAISAAQRTSERVLITGSLHFAGEALAFLRGEPNALEECTQ